MSLQTKNDRKNIITYGASPRDKYNVQDRRKRIITMIHENPSVSQAIIAEAMGVNRSTISRDLKRLSEELKVQNHEEYHIHRERLLMELHVKQNLCENRLDKLKSHAHQGSRWLEEWRKLKDMEAKILGLYSPDMLLIKETQAFDKDQEDASIDAAMKIANFDDNLIDITPQIENKPLADPFEDTEGDII